MHAGNNKIIHNGGWYNHAGEKIGWGDLTTDEFRKVAAEIEEGEIFIVLGERASFWNFVVQPAVIGSLCDAQPEEKDPGLEYVAKHARFAIMKDRICRIADTITNNLEYCGLAFLPMTHCTLKIAMRERLKH